MLYRISFLTEMLVDADNPFEAERIAYNNLTNEVKKRISEVQEICLLSSIEQLKTNEHEIFPWMSPENNGDSVQLTTEEILLAGDKKEKRKKKKSSA